MRLVIIPALCMLLLQGCATAAAVATRPPRAVLDEMGRRCSQDAGLRWFGTRPKGIEVWAPGSLQQKPRMAERLNEVEPLDYVANVEDLLRSGLAAAVYANVRPLHSADVFGPRAGEAAGVYRFELRPWSDPACAPYRRASAAAGQAAPGPKTCVAYVFAGPFDGTPRPNMILNFHDGEASARGFERTGEVLFVDGTVRARSVRYSATKPGVSSEYTGAWGVGACEPKDKRSLYEDLRGMKPY